MPESITEAILQEAERTAVQELKNAGRLHRGLHHLLDGAGLTLQGPQPEAIVKGLEATVRAIRSASNEKQLQDLSVPGVQ